MSRRDISFIPPRYGKETGLHNVSLRGVYPFALWRSEAGTTRFEGFDIQYRPVSGFRATGMALLNIGSKRSVAATGFPSIRDLTRIRHGNNGRQATAAVRPLVIENRADLSGQNHQGQQQSNCQLTNQLSLW